MTSRISQMKRVPDWNSLPSVVPLIDDAGGVNLAAKYLNLSVRTVQSYYQSNDAPRAACWALFWISRWGRGLIAVDAQNDAMRAYSMMAMHQVENRKLKEQLEKLESMVRERPGAASNDPLSVYGTGR